MTDATQPEVRDAAGASTRSTHKPAQSVDARPDDAALASVPPALPFVGASLPPAHPSDAVKHPSAAGPAAEAGTASKGGHPGDDREQRVSTAAGQERVSSDQHSGHGETTGTGAGPQLRNHHGLGSASVGLIQANAADPTVAHDVSAPSQPAVEPMALVGSTVDASLSTAAGASLGTGPTAGPAAMAAADATDASSQVGASLLTLASSPDGSSRMALSLHPKDLGDVHIQLVRDADGAVRVVVAATEPATLRSLIADQAHLHVALDAAAVPTVNRHVSFELATGAAAPDAGAGGQSNGPGSGERNTAMDMSGQDGGQRSGSGRPDHPDGPDAAAAAANGSDRSPFSSRTTLLLRQGSINITA